MELRTDGVYVVTGGAGAIAGAIAKVFREAGARLSLADRPGTSVVERAHALDALAVEADLATVEAAEGVAHRTKECYGRLDGLIHTVGGFAMGAAHEADLAFYERLMDVNMRTLFCATRALLPELLARRDGFIAAISSNVVLKGGGAGMAVYAAAKAAVAAYMRALDAELKGTAVRVAVVYPMAAVDTPANRTDMPQADPEGWVDPEEIGNALLFAATRNARGRLLELPILPRR
jgi:NADP-dependent 3-hydroxy acid dehydrogenase YdfG